jgi:hypothetical protein
MPRGPVRARELAEREEQRALVAVGRPPARLRGRHFSADTTLRRLRREEAELRAYTDAILASRAWRTVELLRGRVGRTWSSQATSVDDGSGGKGRDGPGAPPPGAPAHLAVDPTSEIARLEARVEELAAFLAAVRRSRAWRVTQALRRLVGREW